MNLNRKKISLYLMSTMYVLAGLNHFFMTDFYMKIMPPYIPYHLVVVYVSGLVEIGLGLLLLAKGTKELAAWGIVFLLIAVFPANVYQFTSGQMPLFAFVFRTTIQLMLIIWAYSHTEEEKIT